MLSKHENQGQLQEKFYATLRGVYMGFDFLNYKTSFELVSIFIRDVLSALNSSGVCILTPFDYHV